MPGAFGVDTGRDTALRSFRNFAQEVSAMTQHRQDLELCHDERHSRTRQHVHPRG